MRFKRIRKVHLILFPAVVFLLLVHSLYFNYLSDDAFITFRYAKNFVQGKGIVFNTGERVEGYTNFLWLILLSFLMKLGGDIVVSSRILGVLFGIFNLILLFKISEIFSKKSPLFSYLSLFLVSLCSPFALWMTGGLETHFFTFFILAACLLDLKYRFEKSSLSSLAYAFATLTRPDGIVLFSASLLFKAFYWFRKGGAFARSVLISLGWFLAVFLPYFLWRFLYYGYPFPNTYYAKAGSNPDVYWRGAGYLLRFFSEFGWIVFVLPVLLMVVLAWRRNVAFGYLFTVALFYLLFIIKAGGDQLVLYRFLVPVIPLLYLFVSEALFEARRIFTRTPLKRVPVKWQGAILTLFFLCAAFLTLIPTFSGAHLERIDVEKRSFRDARVIGEWLKLNFPQETKIAVVLAGIVPYYSELYTLDMLGLNDLHIAHREVPGMGRGEPGHEKHDSDYVLSQKPDLIFMAPFFLYESHFFGKDVILYYQNFSRWAPGNKPLLENRDFLQDYKLVEAMIHGKYFPFFRRK